MKLSALYSNQEAIFPRINFREGFNVIFAQINDPENLKKDAHNLGKTFLIDVIEFGLLKQIDKNHPFKQREDLFGEFVFFLEIKTHRGQFVTVRRKVNGRNPVSINISNQSHQDFSNLPDDDWTNSNLSFTESREVLDSYLNLTIVRPYSYRKGVGYFLRRQRDYGDVFRLVKFARGKDQDWKPFLAHILGFDENLISKKYELEKELESARGKLREAEAEAATDSGEYDELRALINVKSESVERLRELVDSFSFKEVENEISEALVNEIEEEVSSLNERKYILEIEIQEINRSLSTKFEFNIDQIKKLYEEVNLVWPNALVKEYDDLVEFNRRISEARTGRLTELREKRRLEISSIQEQLSRLDSRRQEALSALREKETMKKYRQLQRTLIENERELLELEQKLSVLDKASNYEKDIRELNVQIAEIKEAIQVAVRRSTERLNSIRRRFNSYVETVFGVRAILYVQINNEGNIEFKVRTVAEGASEKETFESEGTSYKKMLCACFDLSLLSEYANEGFYHFVYHDGIFESLDDRKKVTLINTIRRECTEKNIQYILTVMDSDMPRDPDKKELLFTSEEIVRLLDDSGQNGRLFRMETF